MTHDRKRQGGTTVRMWVCRLHHRHERRCDMAGKSTGYGRSWKKWLAIYAAVGGVLYLIVYLLFFATDSGGGGLY